MDKKISQYVLEYRDEFYNAKNRVVFNGFDNGIKWEKAWEIAAEHMDFLVDMLRFEQPVYYRESEDAILTSKEAPEVVGEQGLDKEIEDESEGEVVRVVSYALKYSNISGAEICVGWNTKAGLNLKKIDVDAGHLAFVTELLRIEHEVYYDAENQVLQVKRVDPGCLVSTLPVGDVNPDEGDWIVRKYSATYDCKEHSHAIRILEKKIYTVTGSSKVNEYYHEKMIFCNDDQAYHVLKMLHRIKLIEHFSAPPFIRSHKPIACSGSPKAGDSSGSFPIVSYYWEYWLYFNDLEAIFIPIVQVGEEKQTKDPFLVYAQDGNFLASLLKDAKDARTQPDVSTIYSDVVVGWNEYKAAVSVDKAPPGYFAITKLREKYDVKKRASSVTIYWKNADGVEKGRDITPPRSWLRYLQDLLKWEAPAFWNPVAKTILTGREFTGEEEVGYQQALAHPEMEVKPLPDVGNLVMTMATIVQATATISTTAESTASEDIPDASPVEQPLGQDYIPTNDTAFVQERTAQLTFTWKKRGAGVKSKSIVLNPGYIRGVMDLLGLKKTRWFHEPTGEIRFVFKVDEASERPVPVGMRKVKSVFVSLSEKSDRPSIRVDVVDRNANLVELDASEESFGKWVKILATASCFLWNPETKAVQAFF
jgi:hypothetical protein